MMSAAEWDGRGTIYIECANVSTQHFVLNKISLGKAGKSLHDVYCEEGWQERTQNLRRVEQHSYTIQFIA